MNNFTITGPGPEEEFARVESKEDGTFEFTAVESGDWRLIATRGVEEDMPLAAVAPALVSVRDIEGVELRLTESFEIGVTASWGEQKAPEWAARATNLVSLFPVEEQPRLFFDPEQYPGEIFGVFPGRYRVRPYSFSGGFYPAAVMWEGRDVNGQVVEIAPGAAPFQVVYRADSGTLRGTVESSGEKGQGGTVMLTPRDPGEVTFFRQEPVGAGGAFAFTGVPPGDYYVVAFDRADTRDLPLGEIPSAIVPIATSVRIESAGSASVDLRLNRWFW